MPLKVEVVQIPLPGGPKQVAWAWLPNNESARALRERAMDRLESEGDILLTVAMELHGEADRVKVIQASNQRTEWLNALRDRRRRVVPMFREGI